MRPAGRTFDIPALDQLLGGQCLGLESQSHSMVDNDPTMLAQAQTTAENSLQQLRVKVSDKSMLPCQCESIGTH